ncbi:hypothetical protein EBB05_15595 [Methylobacterium brachiatum]|nr:hypothetical protein EBB05_15595 [Methylobacterium brachiatum]
MKEGIRCGPCERKALFTILARLAAAESELKGAWAIFGSRARENQNLEARLTAAESAREAANFMAESWKATAQAEAEIGNERAAEARAALARAERAEKALEDLKGSFHEDSDAYAKITAALPIPPQPRS